MSFSLYFHTLRMLAWRYLRVPLPAVPGWKVLVHEVSEAAHVGGAWVSEDGLEIGAPVAWSLIQRQPDGRLAVLSATCAWTGVPISGQYQDGRLGVRCARCGVPIGALTAGMKTTIDIPSCPPCRRAVLREQE